MLMLILIGLLYFFILMFPWVDKSIFLSLLMMIMLIFSMNQHMMIILVQLEILTLLLFSNLSMKMVFLESSMKIIYVIMGLAVIEVAMGLSLVVKYARYFNKEFLKFSI